MNLFEMARSVLHRTSRLLCSHNGTLELTGRAEKEYNRIMAELKRMTPEERRAVFQNMKQESVRFTKKIDGTTYVVRTFFQSEGNETMLDRAEQFMVRNL